MVCLQEDASHGVFPCAKNITVSLRFARCFDLQATVLDAQLNPCVPVRVNGRLVLVADGIKVGKSGKKMPGV